MTDEHYEQRRDRDLVVLRAIVREMEDGGQRRRQGLSVSDVALLVRDTYPNGTPPARWEGNRTAEQAIHALRRGQYIVVGFGPRRLSGLNGDVYVSDITGDAYRAVGAWPSAAKVADRLLAALGEVAEYSDDPVEKSRARKATEALGGFSRDTLVSVIGAATGVALQ